MLHSAQEAKPAASTVTFLPALRQGVVDPFDVYRALRPNTKLVSVMIANNETGVIQPDEQIGRIAARSRQSPFHTDAIQAAGKLPLDVKAIGCDLLSHLRPQDARAPGHRRALCPSQRALRADLLRRSRTSADAAPAPRMSPASSGWARRRRSRARGWRDGANDSIGRPRDRLEQGILPLSRKRGVNGGGAARVANTSNLYFDHVEGEALVIALDLKGLAVSGGSACYSGSTEPSHVLKAMGLPLARARASLRFSLTRQNTDADIDTALELVPAAVARLRELSPIYKKHLAEAAAK